MPSKPMVPNGIVVTGGGGGIGRHVCCLLARSGYKVFAANRRFDDAFAQSTAELDVVCIPTDLAEPQSVDSFLAELENHDANVIGAILMASPAPNFGLLGRYARAELEEQLSVSVSGHHQMVAGLIERYWRKAARGVVLAVLTTALSDDGATPASANMGGYVVAKAALRTLLQCYGRDYSWLQVAHISPGFTRTTMLSAFDERYIALLDSQGKVAEPDDVGAAIVARFCTELTRRP